MPKGINRASESDGVRGIRMWEGMTNLERRDLLFTTLQFCHTELLWNNLWYIIFYISNNFL